MGLRYLSCTAASRAAYWLPSCYMTCILVPYIPSLLQHLMQMALLKRLRFSTTPNHDKKTTRDCNFRNFRNFGNFGSNRQAYISPEFFGFLQFFETLVEVHSKLVKLSNNFGQKYWHFRNFGPPSKKIVFWNWKPWRSHAGREI